MEEELADLMDDEFIQEYLKQRMQVRRNIPLNQVENVMLILKFLCARKC